MTVHCVPLQYNCAVSCHDHQGLMTIPAWQCSSSVEKLCLNQRKTHPPASKFLVLHCLYQNLFFTFLYFLGTNFYLFGLSSFYHKLLSNYNLKKLYLELCRKIWWNESFLNMALTDHSSLLFSKLVLYKSVDHLSL